jgi:Mce-associated membrane protein
MEGDAGTSRLNPTDADDSTDETDLISEAPADSVPEAEVTAPEAEVASEDRPSRLSRGWFVAMFVVLLLVAAGVATGGYLALHAHNDNVAAARAEDQAVVAAKDCVSATNAPDPAAMAASVQKILDCSTGDFGAYAKVMAPMMVEAYQAANVKVDVTDMRAAAERHNDDGSIDVLVAFRFRAPSNPDTQNQEIGLRLRAKMTPEDGRYKIAKLDPVMT